MYPTSQSEQVALIYVKIGVNGRKSRNLAYFALIIAHFLQFMMPKTSEKSSIGLFLTKLIKLHLIHPKWGHLEHFQGEKGQRVPKMYEKLPKFA